MSINKEAKENDKFRKRFVNIWSKPSFPTLSRQEWQQLEQLVVNYNDFKDDKEHKAGEVVLNDYHIYNIYISVSPSDHRYRLVVLRFCSYHTCCLR